MNNVNTMSGHGGHDTGISFASGANIILSIWLIISPWVVGYESSAMLWNNVIVGAVVLILSAVRLANHNQAGAPSWINVVLGLWLIIAPFALHAMVSGQKWNCVIVGILVALMGLTSGAAGATTRTA